MLERSKIAALDFLYTDTEVMAERESLVVQAKTDGNLNLKQLLIDVSVIIKSDASTGIQRVVRAFLQQLLDRPPSGYQVIPVFATSTHHYSYAPDNFILGKDIGLKKHISESRNIQVYSGDIFFGLDLCAHILPKYKQQLKDWKKAGVKIHVLVYDLLPVLYPEWFNVKTTRNFYKWLRSIAVVADSAICISKPVRKDLRLWLVRKYNFARNTLPVTVVDLGCDISSSVPSKGLPDGYEQLLEKFSEYPTALMVGTLEPRKGHEDVLGAFEKLWQQGIAVNLVIVGKPGWKTKSLQKRLLNHTYLGIKVFWLSNVSDEFLDLIYKKTKGLIIASKGEGYGLPLVEALAHGKPILCRDLIVFRNNENKAVTFFGAAPLKSLQDSLLDWLVTEKQYDVLTPSKIIDWSEATSQLCKLLHINK
jgi:glycosyltransferase involved in cell wall biosynthesis